MKMIKRGREVKLNHFIPGQENLYINMNVKNQVIEKLEEDDYTVLYWYLEKPIEVQNGRNIFEDGSGHKMNKLPRKLNKDIYLTHKLKNIKFNNSINLFDKIFPVVFIIENCRFCQASNKVDSNSIRYKYYKYKRDYK